MFIKERWAIHPEWKRIRDNWGHFQTPHSWGRPMEDNVQNVSGSADNISSHIGQLNKAKDQLMEIISDLSAISEENAASTEETNASMEELNATFSIITESASKLQVLAENMTETISYFKT